MNGEEETKPKGQGESGGEQQQQQQPESFESDDIMGDMMSRLLEDSGAGKEIKPATEEEEEPSGTPGGGDDKPASTDDDKPAGEGKREPTPRVEVVKPKSVQEQVKEELASLQKEQAAQPGSGESGDSKPLEQKKKEPDPPAEDPVPDGIGEDEQDYLDLLAYAAKNDKRYADERKKRIDYLRRLEALKDKVVSDDPDADPLEDDRVKAFVTKNNKFLSNREIKSLERARIAEDIRNELKKDYDPKLDAATQRAQKAEALPIIERQQNEFGASLNSMLSHPKAFEGDAILPQVIERVTKDGLDKAMSDNPMFTGIVKDELVHANTAANEFIKLTTLAQKGINEFDEKNPTHIWLGQFVSAREREFAERGGDRRTKVENGQSKTFVSRAAFAKMSEAEQARHWAWSDRNILGLIGSNAVANMRSKAKNLLEQAKKSGFDVAFKPVEKQEKPVSGQSPKTGGSSSAGAATSTDTNQNAGVMASSELKALGVI